MIAELTRKVLDERGWTLRQAEIRTGINSTSIHNMVIGKPVGLDMAEKFAVAVGQDGTLWRAMAAGIDPSRITPANLADAPASSHFAVHEGPQVYGSNKVQVPIIGRLSAGDSLLEPGNVEGYVVVPDDLLPKGERGFAMRVCGESMTGEHFIDGDVVILRFVGDVEAKNGDYVAASVDGMNQFKTLRLDGKRCWLESHWENGQKDRTEMKPGDAILGVYVGLRRERR